MTFLSYLFALAPITFMLVLHELHTMHLLQVTQLPKRWWTHKTRNFVRSRVSSHISYLGSTLRVPQALLIFRFLWMLSFCYLLCLVIFILIWISFVITHLLYPYSSFDIYIYIYIYVVDVSIILSSMLSYSYFICYAIFVTKRERSWLRFTHLNRGSILLSRANWETIIKFFLNKKGKIFFRES